MSGIHDIELSGCTPEPLMNYLKALGILRLVSEQKDPDATGYWKNDRFRLQSKLDRDALMDFFLKEYRPTPILDPWSGGSGFYPGDNSRYVETIASSETPRATAYRTAISEVRRVLADEQITEKPADKGVKARLLRRFRREMPDEFTLWMDAAMVLQAEGQTFAPVLGTGGNDGRLDFTQNFMQRLIDLGVLGPNIPESSAAFLDQSLFGTPLAGMGDASVGQFAPGRAGGPNATQGMLGDSTDNPWDFVLMMEGTLLLAGAVVRRLSLAALDRAAFPFTVRSRSVGETSLSDDEIGAARGELWLPLWGWPASLIEVQQLFSEGRAEVAGRPARDAVEFARAVAGLGVDRGIRSFVRYGFLRRSGKSYLAAPLERFFVPETPRTAVSLLQELDAWLDSFRRVASGNQVPARYRTALRRLETAMFEYCRYGRREDLEQVLVALGQAERTLALTAGRGGCPPLQRLSGGWLRATHDGSPEYQIALALAGISHVESRTGADEDGAWGTKLGPIRTNLEPVEWDRRRWRWTEVTPRVVWRSADLPTNLAAVLDRRLLDGAGANCQDPPLQSRYGVPLGAIAAWLAGRLNDRRIEELLWGLILVDHRWEMVTGLPEVQVDDECEAPLPRAYALLKLLFLPRPLEPPASGDPYWKLAKHSDAGVRVRPEPGVTALLRANRVQEACRLAYRRLWASGISPLPAPHSSGTARVSEWEETGFVEKPETNGLRLAAALLLPVKPNEIHSLASLVLRPPREIEAESYLEQEGVTVS